MKNNVSKYRELLNVSQPDVAKILGCGRSNVNNVETSDNKGINMAVAMRFTEALIDLSIKQSDGKQCLLIDCCDVFY